jgi:hypothetical protein
MVTRGAKQYSAVWHSAGNPGDTRPACPGQKVLARRAWSGPIITTL